MRQTRQTNSAFPLARTLTMLAVILGFSSFAFAAAADETCVMRQFCVRDSPSDWNLPCKDPNKITNPEIIDFAPGPLNMSA
jgi:hypothetical protein